MGTRLRTGFGREVLELYTGISKDPVTQENFDRIQRLLERALFLRFEGDHFEITFASNKTNLKFPHGLGFVPKDLWLTSTMGAGTLTINYKSFDSSNFDFTIAGTSSSNPLIVRFFAGQFVGRG